jgi:hypothetical protein
MIDFKEAEEIAAREFHQFVTEASNVTLEEIVISDDNSRYEVTFSYDVSRPPMPGVARRASPLQELSSILGKRREFKTFLVTSDGKLKGFKRYKGE